MSTRDSLDASIDKAVKHYSSLFVLPSFKKALLFLALLCVTGGLFSTVTLFPSFKGVIYGLALGFSVFLVDLFADYVTSRLILKRDPVYDLRRTMGLSLFSWLFWFLFVFIGVALALAFGDLRLWAKLCLLGFSAIIILRLIVFNSTTFASNKKILVSSLLQPFLCLAPFLFLWSVEYNLTIGLWLFLAYSPIISLISSFIFTSALNSVGKKSLGVPSLSLFKAFLLNWIAGLTAPFEGFLEKLGREQDVEISILKFAASKPEAIIVVPSVHPGPFKNVGSSLLSSMLKEALEKEFDCIACVPHGLLGHEVDLTSQRQNQKVIKEVVAAANFSASEAKASPLVKVSDGTATAYCQIFGKSAFLSFTLAPKTTEDLPQELGLFAYKEAKKLGLEHCAVINAHNSTDGAMNLRMVLDKLKAVGAKSLTEAFSSRRLPFKIGAAAVMPEEFSLEDGMGPGGITVFVVEVGEQKASYVVIDGNNMVSGLREKIISAVQALGIDECEVFTTDTHAVNAIVRDRRGYHPVGEVMDHEKLIEYIKKTALSALSRLTRVKVSCRSITVPKVKVIGAERLETLCLLTDKVLQKAKRLIIPVFGTAGFLLILYLMFI